MDESDEKEGILKRLRNIESKNKDQLKMTEKKKETIRHKVSDWCLWEPSQEA